MDKETIVESANAVGRTVGSDFHEVDALVKAHELVFAVWQEMSEPDGVATMIIKGERTLRDIAAGKGQSLSWTAIPCISLEQAEALRQVSGESGALH